MTTAVAFYDEALHKLATLTDIREIKKLRKKAIAVEDVAKDARDERLIRRAVEIKKRCERRAGTRLHEMAENGERISVGRKNGHSQSTIKTLSDLGLSKNESSLWGKIAEQRMPEAEFLELVKFSQDYAVAAITNLKELLRQFRAAKFSEKRKKRMERLREIAITMPEGKYAVILADPEWKFEVWSDETGGDASALNHYATSALEDILNRDVPSIAGDDCALLLWATAPMLPQAFEVMAAWGFTYVSQCMWDKQQPGTGYWFRNQHELLLLGTKGEMPCPIQGEQFASVFSIKKTKHSEKPEFAYEIAEKYFPGLPMIELNARKERDGWDAWGLEAPAEAA